MFQIKFKIPTKMNMRKFSLLKNKLSIGIKREEKNVWERRVPITPYHVDKLVKENIKVFIQPSLNRIFTNKEFEKVIFITKGRCINHRRFISC